MEQSIQPVSRSMIATRLLPSQSDSPSTSRKSGRNILGMAVSSVVDGNGVEIHREGVDSAEKSG